MITLFDFQKQHINNLIMSLRKHNFAIDASDTGTGKTYTTAFLLSHTKNKALVICPKVVVPKWEEVLNEANVEIVGCYTYEKFKNCSTPFLKKGRTKNAYEWRLPPNTVVVFDEAHKCGGLDTINAHILAQTKVYNIPTIILSATLAESPIKMRALGYLANMHNFKDIRKWLFNNGCFMNYWKAIQFRNDRKGKLILQRLHSELFPAYGSRMKIKDIPSFPLVSFSAERVPASNEDILKLNALYEEVSRLEELKRDSVSIVELLRARQVSELIKIPSLYEMTTDLLEEGNSVVVFFAFIESCKSFMQMFKEKPSIIWGQQTSAERQANIDSFQSDKKRVICVTFSAGGAGVSLHDLNGNHPRVALMSLTYNAVEMKQAFGRVHRAGALTPAMIRILFVKDSVEEVAYQKIKNKLTNIDLINDGDLNIIK